MRKTVTIVFCDVVDSTPLGESIDAETYRRVISRYFLEVSRVLERHGGTVEKFIGDAVMAVFGIPTLHEDDALRAVRAAAELREALARLNEDLHGEYDVQLGIRIGVNTGEVIAGDPSGGQAFATGEAVTVAQRLQSSGNPGEILIGGTTERLVRDAVLVEPVDSLALKGRSEPMNAWRLLGVIAGAPAFARRLDAPMVGRERELGELRAAFAEVAESRTCRLAAIVGPAGIGKSRLANELLASVRDEASILVGRCLPYGEGITYWPLRDIVRTAAGDLTRERIEELLEGEEDATRIAERVAGAIGISDSVGMREETMWAVRRLLERIARDRPVILGLDDLQWAEPTFLDLIEYLVGWSREAPILIVGLARPELLDRHPGWLSSNPGSTEIRLEPLSEPDAQTLLELLRGDAEVSPAMLARITRASEGNPLFVEQMLAMMIEDGTPVADLAIPPSIHALLAARIDRLDPIERGVIERASVVGKEFWRGAIRDLSPSEERDGVGASLMTLVRKELIHPHISIFPREDAFEFRHILIRDAAYLGIPKESRAELHERYAAWLETVSGVRARELDEIIGYHLEQAFRYRQELGPISEDDQALAARAGDRLGAAGRRAIGVRADVSAGVNLISRAVSLLPTEDPLRRELLTELGSALMRTGDFTERVDEVLDEALAAAAAAGDKQLELRTLIEREFFREYAGSKDASETIPAVAARAIPLLEELGDDLGLAKAWWLKSEIELRAGRWGARAAALDRAVEHARLSGDVREQATLVGLLAQALYYGPTPVEEAIGRCEEFLVSVSGDRSLEAAIGSTLGGLRAMRGEFDEARRLWAAAEAMYEELGLTFRRAARSPIPASIEMLAGEPAAAERELRWGYDKLEPMGEKGVSGTLAAFLGEAIYAQGRVDEAEAFAEIAGRTTANDDLVPQIVSRATRGKVLGKRGELEQAVQLGREALWLVEQTDFPDLHADVLLSMAEILGSGSGEDPSPLLERACEVYKRKGNVVGAERAAQLAAERSASA
jgi:class 3 adenylate cyclase/tetratricopeptide (TPR) repeat protein